MKIAFLSNSFNHHQAPLSDALYKITDGNYYFIETKPLDDERKKMNWDAQSRPSYVISMYEEGNKEKCQEIIDSYDVVILGENVQYIKKRNTNHKLTFVYTERIYKKQCNSIIRKCIHIVRFLHRYHSKSNYLLCAGAFVYSDFREVFTFKNRAYKWGYFPKANIYNIDDVIHSKPNDKLELLYVSRLIGVKHPELPLMVAKRLKDDGISFHLTMIGRGELEEQIKTLVSEMDLRGDVTLIESLKPDEVRSYMLDSNIFLFTSDRGEGWGAVLNEAMNSGCAVVASSEIGAVPYLLKDEENGLIYQDGNLEDLYKKVRILCDDSIMRKRLGLSAYYTITDLWNADIAAERLLLLVDDISKHKYSNRFKTGPCSPADIMKNGWYK